MEKAILKTLIYADIFDYPLEIYEIHKWLIGRKANLRQVEKALGKLVQSSKCKVQNGHYFLPRKDGLVTQRRRRAKQSAIYLRKTKILCQLLKIIPWMKLVGISGGLALDNASKKDDIDLFIITSKNRLWICRLLILGLLSLTGQRRKRGEKGKKIAGKVCTNILLDEASLEQKSKDIFIAHELLQMRVLWQRDGVYSRYLESNSWAMEFLPNWVGHYQKELRIMNYESRKKQKNHNSLFILHNSLVDFIENFAKWFQLKIMQGPKGMERIEEGALYFHPNDIRTGILNEYRRKVSEY